MAFYCYEKEKLQMSSKYIFIKGFLLIREMPIKTTLTFYLAPVRMTVIKKANDIECWWECGEAVLILTAVGNMNW